MLEPKGLAEPRINGLPRRYAPRRDGSASLRTPSRHCERSEAIHLADNAVPNHGLPRPKGLAETSINGLPRRFAPRRDGTVRLTETGHRRYGYNRIILVARSRSNFV